MSPASTLCCAAVAVFVATVVIPSSRAEEKKLPPPKGTEHQQTAEADEDEPPRTLEEAHLKLEKIFSKDDLADIDAMKSERDMARYHLGLGMGMRNSWGLWGGGPLAQHMNKLGFHHPDDMSGVILATFWCKRHQEDFRLEERAAYFAAYWKAMADPPAAAKDPKDGAAVEWNVIFNAGDRKTPRMIHVGKSLKSGRWLAYEHDKGVYEPDAELLKKITDFVESNPVSSRVKVVAPLPPRAPAR